MTLPGDGRDIDFDDVIVSADGTIVQWDDDRVESHDADGRENDQDDDWGDRDDAYDDADDDADDDSANDESSAGKAQAMRLNAQVAMRAGEAFPPARKAKARAVLPWHDVAWAEEPSSATAPSTSAPAASASDATAAQAAPSTPDAQPSKVDASSVLGSRGPYLIVKEQVESPDGPMTVIAAASLASAAESARRMAWALAAIMAVVLAAVVAFAWMLAGRTLRPVEAMRAQAASITADNLQQRIDVPASDADLARLAETLNDLLARVERSLEEEKRFISDASHELKSPLAASSVIIDTLRAYPDELDAREALDDLAGENARMASIVGDMLTLTRYDEGRLKCSCEPIDLMDVILEEAMALNARCNCAIDTAGVQPIVCRADAELLRHALRNLLDNAARYARSVVKVSCEQGEGHVVVTVSDDGCGIAPEDRERVFGRFVCLDERSGTGLGLAVVASAIAAHGGSVRFIDPDPALPGATVRIELPS